jgi:hypothetical protein
MVLNPDERESKSIKECNADVMSAEAADDDFGRRDDALCRDNRD